MHEVLDAISLELARRVAARVEANPDLVETARRNLERWKERNADSPSLLRCYREWEVILDQPVAIVCAVLCARTDEGQRLRQNSPFAGVLSPREVWEIKREFRSREATPA